MKISLRLILLITLVVMISACSSSPGSTELKNQVKPKLAKPFWDVASIRKIDGKIDESAKAASIESYGVKYEYVVKFKKGITDLRNDLKKQQAADRKKMEESRAKALRSSNMEDFVSLATVSFGDTMNSTFDGRDGYLNELQTKFGNFKAGETKKFTDTCFFEKTEKGWVLIDLTL